MHHLDFEIRILRQHWISDDGKYDETDICSHGFVYARIGPEVICHEETLSVTTSSSALYLMRTLGQNVEQGQFSNQLLPCCGHFLVPDEEEKNQVIICGCDTGVDWSVKHQNGDVLLTSEKGTQGKIPFDTYRKMIIQYANKVESFYGNPNRKVPNESDRKGFEQFWAEWRELKSKWS